MCCRKRALPLALVPAVLFAACSDNLGTDPSTSMLARKTGVAASSVSLSESRITFRSSRDDNFEIYFMNADGTGVTQVTNNPAEDGSPAWRP